MEGFKEPVRHVLYGCALVFQIVNVNLFAMRYRCLSDKRHSSIDIIVPCLVSLLALRLVSVFDVRNIPTVTGWEEGVREIKVY